MPNKENIFPEETELSEIVLHKTNQAFEMIRQEDTDHVDKTAFSSKSSQRVVQQKCTEMIRIIRRLP